MDETQEAYQQQELTDTPGQQNISGPNQVVQFDLVAPQSEMQLKNTYYGRRKPPADLCPDVKEALKWAQPDHEPEFGKSRKDKKNFDQVTQIVMERSP